MECIQYTIRGVPAELDRRLREEARASGKSLNRVILDTLEAAKLSQGPPFHDLDWFLGSGQSDPEEEAALRWLDALPRDASR